MTTLRRGVLLRADASEAIGAGHVIRCGALAEELERRGLPTIIASRLDLGDVPFSTFARRLGLAGIGRSPQDEVDAILSQIAGSDRYRPLGWVVMDHYGLGAEWLRHAQRLASRRLVIDDLADRRLPCEALINQNLDADPGGYARLVKRGTRLLLGTRYALIRSPFRVAHERGPRASGAVRRVLITMGGSDRQAATALAVDAVRLALPDAHIDVVSGGNSAARRSDTPGVRVHRSISGEAMADLMTQADLAVGASGTTTWERCAAGLPSVLVPIADNQRSIARRLAEAGAAVDAGPVEELRTAGLAGLVRELADDLPRRQSMSLRCRRLVDGRGSERVAHVIDGIRFRQATLDDAELLWRWANDPATRANSFQSDPIPYPDHIRWLTAKLSNPASLQLLAWNRAGMLGQVRFDDHGDEVEVSLAAAPEHRGTVGTLMLESALRRVRSRWSNATIVARVKPENEASRRMFQRAGFVLFSEKGGVLRYRLNPENAQ